MKVWGVNHTSLINVHEVLATSETPAGLELTCDVGDQDVTVALDARGVRELRLILTRYERQHRSTDTTGE